MASYQARVVDIEASRLRVLHACVKLTLRPEDGGQSKGTWEVLARVQHPMRLPPSYRSAKKAETGCAGMAGETKVCIPGRS